MYLGGWYLQFEEDPNTNPDISDLNMFKLKLKQTWLN